MSSDSYLSCWKHSPHKRNKNCPQPRTEVLGWQILWDGTEHRFEFALIIIRCNLSLLLKKTQMEHHHCPDTRITLLVVFHRVHRAVRYLISEPNELCTLHVSLSQVGQNFS